MLYYCVVCTEYYLDQTRELVKLHSKVYTKFGILAIKVIRKLQLVWGKYIPAR